MEAPRQVRAGRTYTVVVGGLAFEEYATITITGGGTTTRQTRSATQRGVIAFEVEARGKPGSREVRVVGAKPNRVGTATVRVVRS